MNTKDNLKEIDVNPITLANNYYPKEAWIVIKNLTTLVARGSEKLRNTIPFKIKWG
ncbi:hypothetical protein [Clostridium sporogenes]|uniref:hypothetical protein n=1 Tax=Clostridium sporogenes TaxID=1509 RepID=UPI001FAD5EEF|nr:hypothetical protein [Clostridium sporogenes]